jgi:Cu(I)/Ag(I) efflux system membrane fusion protein
MSDRISPPASPAANGALLASTPPDGEGGLRAPSGLGPWGKFWWWLKFWLFVKTARLRFIAVLVGVGAVIAYWETLNAYYERWTRPAAGQAVAHADTEFWCPMHPAIVRDHPDKCPICGMPLSQRKRGDKADEEPLPSGAVSRVQLSPYRVALAGLKTWEVGYRPLAKEIQAAGFVEFDERKLSRITARVTGKSRIDKLFVNVTGQTVKKGDPLAELYSPDLVVTMQNLLDADKAGNRGLLDMAQRRLELWGIKKDQVEQIRKTHQPITSVLIRSPISGHVIRKYQVEGEYVEEGARLFDVADLSEVWIEAQVYEDELAFMHVGLCVEAVTRANPNRTFHGHAVEFVNPHLDAGTRTLKVRFSVKNADHALRPGMYATVRFATPAASLGVFTDTVREEWRNGSLVAGLAVGLMPSHLFPEPSIGPLVRAALDSAAVQLGQVLAVPETAVIDTGSRKFVYREARPGVYDGVEVRLGPRCGDFYPVARGLQAGDKVVTAGSFLVDAETRLSGAAGSTYFGASGGPQSSRAASATEARPSTGEDVEAKIQAGLAKLSRVDRRLAEAQRFCPVLQSNRLGKMGPPHKVILDGQPVFLCCSGCEDEARTQSKRTLSRVEQFRGVEKLAAKPAQTGDKEHQVAEEERRQEEAGIKEALAKLGPEDRRLAEAQRYCVILQGNRLGSMNPPLKEMVRGQPVFLCCRGCLREFRANPDRALATAERLKAKRETDSPSR